MQRASRGSSVSRFRTSRGRSRSFSGGRIASGLLSNSSSRGSSPTVFTSSSLPSLSRSGGIIALLLFAYQLQDISTPDSSSSSASVNLSSRSTTPEIPSLESVFTLCQDTSLLIRGMDCHLRSVEDKTQQLLSTLKELNDYNL